MSVIQPQQQPQPQQQRVVVYPNTASNKSPTHHSGGSFGPVFIVLAIIIVVSTLACFLGRLCNKLLNKQNPNQTQHKEDLPKEGNLEFENHKNIRPKVDNAEFWNHSFRPNSKDGDIEFGFDKNIPNVKLNVNRENRGFKTFKNGGINGQMKHSDDNNGPKDGA